MLARRRTRPGPAALLFALLPAAGLAACGGDDAPAVEGPTSPSLDVQAAEMYYEPDAVAVEAGTVEVVLRNVGTVLHDLRIEDQPFIVEASAGEDATATVTLEPGTYDFYCSLPGHRDAGMEGVLEVR
ncbi:MAG TPA: plastocyanin/azurin family copper-binding protein [Acidimicrobiales bacterium]|nr:plastocyanin/azurin family copper-binding protein [Acidimicrobiales bacterium]